MTTMVFFVEQIAIGLYILIGVAFAYIWWKWVKTRRAYRSTYFELERDLHRNAGADYVTVMILIFELLLVVVGIQRVVAPTIRGTFDMSELVAMTVQDGVYISPTPFVSGNGAIDPSGVQLGEEDPAAQVFVTPTLTPTPVGTILPNAPPIVGCENLDAAWLQVPTNGMVVFEPINVVGVANTDDFAYYRFELRGPSTNGNYAILQEYTQPVASISELGQIVPSFYELGEYQFRLTVFDTTNALQASCMVTIYIREPIPTPTPIAPAS